MFQIPLGLGGACTARIGQYLGANDPNGAVNVSRVTIFVTSMYSTVLRFCQSFIDILHKS
jgi:Na+-driven multidrug efflux pump